MTAMAPRFLSDALALYHKRKQQLLITSAGLCRLCAEQALTCWDQRQAHLWAA